MRKIISVTANFIRDNHDDTNAVMLLYLTIINILSFSTILYLIGIDAEKALLPGSILAIATSIGLSVLNAYFKLFKGIEEENTSNVLLLLTTLFPTVFFSILFIVLYLTT